MKSKTDIIHPATEQSIRNAGLALANGSLVVIPTETVYGLAANALNPTAATAIFEAKQRPFFDPLICHISDYEMLNLLTGTLSAQMRRLTEAFWPGPLTIVVPKLTEVPEIITAGLTTVAIRMPSHPVCTAVIKAAGVPLAAPSANLFGKLSPTRPEHTLELSSSVHSIIDGGPCTIGIESTIIREIDGRFVLLRPGKITAHQIESALNIPVIPTEETELPDAPGQLPSHYSPNSQVILIDEGATPSLVAEHSVLLAFRRSRKESPFAKTIVLSSQGSLTEAASKLFESLHTLDALSPSAIFVETVPEEGIGVAIMNRLKKAAFRE